MNFLKLLLSPQTCSSYLILLTFVSFSSIQANNKIWYTSNFVAPNQLAMDVLVKGQILAPDEKPNQMIERVVNSIASAEILYKNLYGHNAMSVEEFATKIGNLMDEGAIVFSTPILTNAGRFNNRPLSACAMPPVDLKSDFKKIKKIVDQYHQDGMGTGFDLSDSSDPITLLKYLNEVAVEGSHNGKEQRPVGNMAILNINSPHIEQFIMIKVGGDQRGENWKFNISVNITNEFMDAVKENREFTLLDGKKISAKKLLDQIAYAAHQCGDPGLISLERLNKDNPTPSLGEYKTTAPCAEVGLAPGETCIFGYINLASLITDLEDPSVNFDKLKDIVKLLTRSLDNILEISIQNYLSDESKFIMQQKRKISIGICGFADMLIALNLSYTQQEARDLIKDILNFISYHSKIASLELAKYRGSFGAIEKSKYMDQSYLIDKYGNFDTPHVSAQEWKQLAKNIKETKLLRNATTTALPPTGRSALVIGASTGIEPLFSLHTSDGIYTPLRTFLKKNNIEDSSIIKEIFETGSCTKSMS